MEAKKKWYQKTWGIIVLLILFFPAGLYLMWKYSGWKSIIKWVISGLFALLIVANQSGGKNKETPQTTPAPQAKNTEPTNTPKSTQRELDATVKFSDVAFMITNNEDKDWTNCRLELNSGILKGGYVYKAGVMIAKDALIVPFREFTKGDGTRFNAYDTKAQNLSISCDVDREHGFNYFAI
jgi:hypothetical protein